MNVAPVGSVSGDRLMPTREMNVPLRRLLSPPCQMLVNGKTKYQSYFGPWSLPKLIGWSRDLVTQYRK